MDWNHAKETRLPGLTRTLVEHGGLLRTGMTGKHVLGAATRLFAFEHPTRSSWLADVKLSADQSEHLHPWLYGVAIVVHRHVVETSSLLTHMRIASDVSSHCVRRVPLWRF